MSKAVATREPVTTVLEVPGIESLTATEVKREWDRDTVLDRVAQIQAAGTAIAKAGEPVMVAQAMTLVNMTDYSKVIGKGDGALYPTAEAAQNAIGVDTKSYGTRLLRLGRAMVRHNVRKGSADYRFLCRHADAAFFSDTLGTTVDKSVDTEVFKKKMAEAVALYKANGGTGSFPSSAKVKELTTGQESTRSPGGDTDQTERQGQTDAQAKAATQSGPVTLGDWRAVVRDLESALKRLSDQDAEQVHQMLVNLVAGDQKRRRALAAKAKADGAPKPKAPKGRPAKVAAATVEAKAEAPEPQPEVTPEPQPTEGE